MVKRGEVEGILLTPSVSLNQFIYSYGPAPGNWFASNLLFAFLSPQTQKLPAADRPPKCCLCSRLCPRFSDAALRLGVQQLGSVQQPGFDQPSAGAAAASLIQPAQKRVRPF